MRQKLNKPNVIKGMFFSWSDDRPFSSKKRVVNGKVGHRNPTYNIVAKVIWRDCCDFILETPFYFLIKLQVVFSAAKHGEQDKLALVEIETKERYSLSELNRIVRKEIMAEMRLNKDLAEGHKNKGTFETVNFHVEIVKI